MAQRSVPAPFLTKTYHLVDDLGTDGVVSWNEADDAFVVWKTGGFAKDLLPKYFKHNNFPALFVSSIHKVLIRQGVAKLRLDEFISLCIFPKERLATPGTPGSNDSSRRFSFPLTPPNFDSNFKWIVIIKGHESSRSIGDLSILTLGSILINRFV